MAVKAATTPGSTAASNADTALQPVQPVSKTPKPGQYTCNSFAIKLSSNPISSLNALQDAVAAVIDTPVSALFLLAFVQVCIGAPCTWPALTCTDPEAKLAIVQYAQPRLLSDMPATASTITIRLFTGVQHMLCSLKGVDLIKIIENDRARQSNHLHPDQHLTSHAQSRLLFMHLLSMNFHDPSSCMNSHQMQCYTLRSLFLSAV